ncbi:MAG: hypothetical protein HZB14_08145 [Actinobacteria bacterium]|nr:hypothetical protein [Actinomycetota bacterium]
MAFRRDKTGADDVDAEIVIDAEIADDAAAGSAPLPVERNRALEARELRAIEARREGDIAIRNVAVATAGGIAAGAATVVIARTVQRLAKPAPGLARRRRSDVVASRSFMVDVHMLKPQR